MAHPTALAAEDIHVCCSEDAMSAIELYFLKRLFLRKHRRETPRDVYKEGMDLLRKLEHQRTEQMQR